MKFYIKSVLFLLMIAYMGVQAWANDHSRLVTVTLLPVMENCVAETPEEAQNLLWVQKTPLKEIVLQFDLSVLPAGLTEADFKECTLRLVAQKVIFIPSGNEENTGYPRIRIKGRLGQNGDNSSVKHSEFIVALSVLKEKDSVTLNQETSPEFRKAIYAAYSSREKKVSFSLLTEVPRAGSLFYSSKSFGDSPSNIPRLLINYSLGQPALRETLSWSQYQQNPEHTGRNPWIPFKNPTGFTLQQIEISKRNGSSGSIADYPLIYWGNIYLINKISNENYLVALDFKGNELWRAAIGKGTVQRSPVISHNGILYVITENQIAGYDLNASGQRVARYPHEASGKLIGALSAYTDLTMGNDGSLFLALKENNVNYIYGFTHELKPFIKSGHLGKGEDKISTVTVNSDGQKIFAQTPEGAVVIDITDPSKQQTILIYSDSKPWEYFHTPVAGPTKDGMMIFADFTSTANKGNVWGYATDKRIWSTHDTLIPQPALGSNDLVYFIQNGGLQRHKVSTVGSGETSEGKKLNTTSNLVMDGADNIYFWDNGYLYGYSAKAETLFTKIDFTKDRGLHERDKGASIPEQFIRFMLGPAGTLWANNKNGNALFAFTPSYAETDLRLTKNDDIKDQTYYRTNGILSVGAVTVKESARVLFQARNGISFSKGFTVKKSAGVLCRTGF